LRRGAQGLIRWWRETREVGEQATTAARWLAPLDVPVKALDLPARLVTPAHVPQRGKPDRSVANKGALYFHFPAKEDLAAGVFAEHLAIALPPQDSTLQELVASGLVLTHRLQPAMTAPRPSACGSTTSPSS
jgi:hypothetical protein